MSERCNLKTLTAALCCFYQQNPVLTAKFSRDQFIMDGPPEKLRRELEDELKMHCDQPQSHAWYHGAIPRQVAENLVQRDGDFLVRDSLSSPGSYVLTCQWRNAAQHFKINKKAVSLNEAYCREEYLLDREGFHSVPALIRYSVGNRTPVSQVVGAIIFQPINRGLPLRCLEEKYGLAGGHIEAGLTLPERRSHKRLSLNIINGHTCDATHTHDNVLVRDNQLRLKDRCGSQPASLNQVQERRLKTHQSESFLPLGAHLPGQSQYQDPHLLSNPKSPVFRTGSEPALSPSVSRRTMESQGGQAIRGSDSQLCPKPPPKPSKVPSMRLARAPCLLPPHSSYTTPVSSSSSSSSSPACLPAPPMGSSCSEGPSGVWRSGGSTAPPVPPVKPLKFQHQLQMISSDCQSLGNVATPPDDMPVRTADHSPSIPQEWEEPDVSDHTPKPSSSHAPRPELQPYSYVERLRREETAVGRREEGGGGREEEKEERGGGGRRREGLDRSSYHNAIAALENTSGEEEEDRGTKEDEGEKDAERWRREDERRGSFRCPVVETVSAFRPAEFGSRLLPGENKPLEMMVLKRVKELLLRHTPQSIARHLLLTDCQVARILGVSSEVKGQMGVASGLELVTLPHGRQLRLDLMERHHTMAIGVAVDILGCTGSVEERASTLNRIIMVAMELKDTVGDLYAFTALMKALEMPQISRLEQTWTTLRRSFTQTAISYEKILKPFYTHLYEGTASLPPVVCVPLLLPLLSLMERPSFTQEGAELWEISDQGCDIMLRHLEAARGVAGQSRTHTENTHTLLQGFHGDPDLLEVFQTDFQLRLLWGSRGASVNQSDRYNKFTLILTALSRKLEPPKTHITTQI